MSVYSEKFDAAVKRKEVAVASAWHYELQALLNWSWDQHQFECIPGII